MDGIGTTPPPGSNPPTTSMDNPTRGRTDCETSSSNLNISNPSQGCANVSPLLPAQTTPTASAMDIIETPPEDGFQIAISKKRQRKNVQDLVADKIGSENKQRNSGKKSSYHSLDHSNIKTMVRYLKGTIPSSAALDPVEMAHRPGIPLSSSSTISTLALGPENTSNMCGAPKVFNELDDSCVIQIIPANTTTASKMIPNMLPSLSTSYEPCTGYCKSNPLDQNKEGITSPLTGSSPSEGEEDQVDPGSMTKKKGRPFGSKNKKKGINPPTTPNLPTNHSSAKAVSGPLSPSHER
ncbi:hypothetical protein SUGI_0737300 [Cryptomeria japonica]|nr:hypothetical protein SUGI_0737300 [Cryptomeria japonica]